ncbi:magnesium transporter [Homoserinimonas sp. OAct 916]|uniref:magnesium transporter n=1 Tax=Homoserinimonas sp. OAct 916 TaxID=2211450 RepID=UPI000DBEA106|nr:magnesium transporter [Homoserinimonas sp. OAct 916]
MIELDALEVLEDSDETDLRVLRAALREVHTSEIVALMGRISFRRRALLFRLLPKEEAVVVFEALDAGLATELLGGLRDEKVGQIIEDLDPDDRVGFLDELPANVAKKLLLGLSDKERKLTATLMGYPVGSIGRRMSPEFIKVLATMTAAEALEHVREAGQHATTIYFLPVAAENRIVVGAVELRDLLMAEPDTLVEELMHDPILIRVTDPEEPAARRVVEADVIATAVVDLEDRLVGLFTFDDAAQILSDAEDEDAARTGGAEPLRQPYLTARLWAVVRSRVVWLFVLVGASSLTVAVQGAFEATLEQSISLALFIPMLIGAGGNIGAQAATTLTRALALEEVRPKDIIKVMFRELRVGLMLGAAMGLVGFIPAALLVGPDIALVLLLTVTAIGTLAATVGGSIPLGARAAKVDPAIVSAPFISTFVDASGLVIYFLIARAVLGI